MEFPNYTGPYLSDGKFQSSVEFGSTQPVDELDKLSRLHDSAYAKYDDYGHRTAADSIYNRDATALAGKFPQLAANLVLYGNAAGRSASNIASSMKYGPLGFVVGAVKNMYNLNDYVVNGRRYKQEVSDYYDTDPMALSAGFQPGVSRNDSTSGITPQTFNVPLAERYMDRIDPYSKPEPRMPTAEYSVGPGYVNPYINRSITRKGRRRERKRNKNRARIFVC